MKCRTAAQLLEFNRDGEMSDREKRDLDQHLQSCEACRKKFIDAIEMTDLISSLRTISPEPRNADLLTHKIMQRIPLTTSSATFWRSWDLMLTPRVRLALGMTLLVFSGTFLFQTQRDAREISALEEQLSRSVPASPSSIEERLHFAGANLPWNGTAHDFARAMGSLLPGTLPSAKLAGLVDGSSARRPMASSGPSTFAEYLRKKYPRLASIQLNDGLDQNERLLLETEGREFVRDIETWIRKGERDHEHH